MAENNNDMDFGYGDVDEVQRETGGGNKYLSFKKGDKGRVLQLRIASLPKYLLQHWITKSDGKEGTVDCEGAKCAYCGDAVPKAEKVDKTAKWAWTVIDRDDNAVKVFTGPTQIATRIKELSQLRSRKRDKSGNLTGDLMWGDPRTFDVQIERTEIPGNYYTVTALPEGKGEMTDEEKAQVEKAGYDLEKELRGKAKTSENTGNYQTQSLETAPENEEQPKSNDKEDEVSPDDIPF